MALTSPADYLLDTSAYSAFKRGHRDIVGAVLAARSVIVSPIVLGELHQGFLRGARRRQNHADLTEFLATPSIDTMPIDDRTGEVYAAVYHDLRRRGTMIPINDVWIAATAIQHGLVVLTTDRHFGRIETLRAEIHAP